MPNVILNFNHNINESVQIGDVGYYTPTHPVPTSPPPIISGFANALGTSTTIPNVIAGPSHASTTLPHMTQTKENVIMIGPVIAVTLTSMFSKDNKANVSSLLGYYSLLKLRNNSTTKAEMFSVGADFVESSK